MANFEKCIDYPLQWEGEQFTNDPSDPGGATKWGVTLAELKLAGEKFDLDHDGDIDADDVKLLTKDISEDFYHAKFWDEDMDLLVKNDIAAYYLGYRINMGPVQATKLFQRAVNDFFGTTKLVDDGSFGKKSVSAINEALNIDATRLWVCLQSKIAAFYWNIVSNQLNKNPHGLDAESLTILKSAVAAKDRDALARAVKAVREQNKQPGLAKFIPGWLNRTYAKPINLD